MNVIVLDATTKTISVVLVGAKATADPTYSVHYQDASASAYTEGAGDGLLNGTTPITVLASPAASTRRVVRELTIYNADTASITATIHLLNSNGSTDRIIRKVTLAVGETYTMSDGATSGGTTLSKAAASDVATGTDDTKYVTAKAIKDSVNVPNVVPSTAGKLLVSDGTNWTSAALGASQLATAVAPSTSGNVLTSNGSAWISAAPAAGGAMDYDQLHAEIA